jgi:hypothetical protein
MNSLRRSRRSISRSISRSRSCSSRRLDSRFSAFHQIDFVLEILQFAPKFLSIPDAPICYQLSLPLQILRLRSNFLRFLDINASSILLCIPDSVISLKCSLDFKFSNLHYISFKSQSSEISFPCQILYFPFNLLCISDLLPLLKFSAHFGFLISH